MYTDKFDNHLSKYINDIFEKSFKEMDSSMGQYDKGEVQEYINKTLRSALGSKFYDTNNNKMDNINMQGSTTNRNVELFKIHGFYIFRVAVPENINTREIKTYLRADQLLVSWKPGEEEEVFSLPSNIVRSGVKAIVKDNILELRLPVNTDEERKRINLEFM